MDKNIQSEPRELSHGEVLNLICINLATQGGQLVHLEKQNQDLTNRVIYLNAALQETREALNALGLLDHYEYEPEAKQWISLNGRK